jgi:hypothetical protein
MRDARKPTTGRVGEIEAYPTVSRSTLTFASID